MDIVQKTFVQNFHFATGNQSIKQWQWPSYLGDEWGSEKHLIRV